MKRLKKIFSIVTVAFFLCYYASSSMFVHTHSFEWGSVTHSHPCVPQSSHSHSAAACTAIASFYDLSFDVATAATAAVLLAVAYRYATLNLHVAQSQSIRLYPLRAPPFANTFVKKVLTNISSFNAKIYLFRGTAMCFDH